ncbi:MAG: alpha/beta-type small acid-soluble spore protein [Clostridia bacterium]
MSNKQAKAALNKFKYEVANELGVNLKQGYNGDLTSKEAGSIGGEMTKKLVAQAASQMQSQQPNQ